MKKPGFSLMELSIVCMIIAVLCLVGIYTHSWFNHILVHQELNRLHTTFIALSARAMLYQTPCHFVCTNDQLVPGVQFGATNTFTPHAQGAPEIAFYPNGKMKSGTLYLTDRNEQCLYCLTIPVGHVSYMRRYKLHHNQWVLLA